VTKRTKNLPFSHGPRQEEFPVLGVPGEEKKPEVIKEFVLQQMLKIGKDKRGGGIPKKPAIWPARKKKTNRFSQFKKENEESEKKKKVGRKKEKNHQRNTCRRGFLTDEAGGRRLMPIPNVHMRKKKNSKRKKEKIERKKKTGAPKVMPPYKLGMPPEKTLRKRQRFV